MIHPEGERRVEEEGGEGRKDKGRKGEGKRKLGRKRRRGEQKGGGG